jgi:hypothetical protein
MSVTIFLLLSSIALPALLIVGILVDASRNKNALARETEH